MGKIKRNLNKLTKMLKGVTSKLSSRDKNLLIFASCVLTLCLIGWIFSTFNAYIEKNKKMTIVRSNHIQQLQPLLNRHKFLSSRLNKVQDTLQNSELSFEQVTQELDKIIKDSIGSNIYDLKKSRTASEIGFDFEKQELKLNIKSLTLDQVVKLLSRIENGKAPLFLGKVDIKKSRKKDFDANFEIFSIKKSKVF